MNTDLIVEKFEATYLLMNLAKRKNMSGAFYFYFLGKTGCLGNPGSGKQEAGLMGEHFLLLSLATEGTTCRHNILNQLEIENIAQLIYIGLSSKI